MELLFLNVCLHYIVYFMTIIQYQYRLFTIFTEYTTHSLTHSLNRDCRYHVTGRGQGRGEWGWERERGGDLDCEIQGQCLSAWVRECVSACVCVCVSEWVSEWMSDSDSYSDFVAARTEAPDAQSRQWRSRWARVYLHHTHCLTHALTHSLTVTFAVCSLFILYAHTYSLTH